MRPKTSITAALAAVALWLTFCPKGLDSAEPRIGPSLGGRPFAGPAASGAKSKKWNEAEHVFAGRLTSVEAGPVGRSLPPVYTHTLHFTVEKVLRGPLESGQGLTASHVARQHDRPTFPVGKSCLVAADRSRGRLVVQIVEESTPQKLQSVTLACRLPMGWSMRDGKPVCPWAKLGENTWSGIERPADAEDAVVCSVTGRPALLAGGEVTFQVESVPPKQAIQWTNPDGDGEYRITLTNPSDKPLTVDALLSRGDTILWEESLVILCQGKVYTCPGSQGVSTAAGPTRLAPGQSVSTIVNVLRLDGPTWPQGGYRIEFRFCLGEKSRSKSLYYMTRHHGKLRQTLSP